MIDLEELTRFFLKIARQMGVIQKDEDEDSYDDEDDDTHFDQLLGGMK